MDLVELGVPGPDPALVCKTPRRFGFIAAVRFPGLLAVSLLSLCALLALTTLLLGLSLLLRGAALVWLARPSGEGRSRGDSLPSKPRPESFSPWRDTRSSWLGGAILLFKAPAGDTAVGAAHSYRVYLPGLQALQSTGDE